MLKKRFIGMLLLGCFQPHAEAMQENSSQTKSPYDERVERYYRPDVVLATQALKSKRALLIAYDRCCNDCVPGVCYACACAYAGETFCCLNLSKCQPCMEVLCGLAQSGSLVDSACGLSAESASQVGYASCIIAGVTAALGYVLPLCRKKLGEEVASADLELAKRTYKKKAE